jgi:hypothetical protein
MMTKLTMGWLAGLLSISALEMASAKKMLPAHAILLILVLIPTGLPSRDGAEKHATWSVPGAPIRFAAPMASAMISANALASKATGTGAATSHVSASGTAPLALDVGAYATTQECAWTVAGVSVMMHIAVRRASYSALHTAGGLRISATIRANATTWPFASATYGTKAKPVRE